MSEPLVLIHPIGVGLSGRFWDRFNSRWQSRNPTTPLLAPDLLGCGDAPMPKKLLSPEDWAAPLVDLLRQRGLGPVVLVSQGASLPIALALIHQAPELVSRLVAISPPSWTILSQPFPRQNAERLWGLLFQGPIGALFYRYARRKSFLRAFSENNLFASKESVDREWLDMLCGGSRNMASRWAVYSFLAGFWRRNWEPQLHSLTLPVLVIFGQEATGIGRSKSWDDGDQRIADYRQQLPTADVRTISGRNVLPFESTDACIEVLQSWL